MNFFIKIEKYIWQGSLAPEDANFFSNSAKTLWGTVTLNASEDLLTPPVLRTARDAEDEGEILLHAADINLSISDLSPLRVRRPGNTFEYVMPRVFFDISIPFGNSKFFVTITKNSNVREPVPTDYFMGVITPAAVSEAFSVGDDSHVIDLIAVGLEKEFKDRFSAVELPELGGWTPYPLFPPGYVSCKSLTSALSDIFNLSALGGSVVLAADIADWQIAALPVLNFYTSTGTSIFISNGYNLIRDNGENSYDFLRRLCNAMGWVFFFHLKNLYIKNRSSSESSSTVTLDYFRDVSECVFSREDNPNLYDLIVIPNGFVDGTGDAFPVNQFGKGDRNVFVRANKKFSNGQNHWNSPGYNDHYFGLSPSIPYSFNFNGVWKDNQFSYNVWETDPPYSSGAVFRLYSKAERVLRLDAGASQSKDIPFGWVIRISWGYLGTGRNERFQFSSTPVHNDDFIFTANYGSCLFRKSTDLVVRVAETYSDYVSNKNGLNIFQNNWAKYSGYKNAIDISCSTAISSPLSKILFNTFPQNGVMPFPLYANSYSILELEWNIFHDFSKLKIQAV